MHRAQGSRQVVKTVEVVKVVKVVQIVETVEVCTAAHKDRSCG